MISTARYTCRIAASDSDVVAAQELRFQVFNLELEEGLDHSYLSNLDRDRFDEVCKHLIVKEEETGNVIGTYRFQSGTVAQANHGYYSEQEFDLSNLDVYRTQVLELGRACIHRDHRNISVLNLLWREIARYATENGLRFLIGCSSLTSQDPVYGLETFNYLKNKNHLVSKHLETPPRPAFECLDTSNPRSQPNNQSVKIPRLLGAYLLIGAKIGGRPAIDREFKTIDFLTLLDLDAVPLKVYRRYFT